MANGIYLVNYTGQQGFGSASMIFRDGEVHGADVAGGEYSGTYIIANERVNGDIQLSVPSGVALVTGATSNQPTLITIPFSMSSTIQVGQVEQIRVQLPTGPVNANIKKVKNF